jgi:RNA polymerase sigma-70 factor, ECF subfamily
MVLPTTRSAPVPAAPYPWARLREQDPLAFRAFVVAHQRAVFALLSRITGRGHHVDDLAQETFMRAYQALPRFDPGGSATVSTWLLTIATRLAIDAKRKKDFGSIGSYDDRPGTHRSPEAESNNSALGRALEKAAAELPDDQRAALVLAEFHGFSLAELADALGIPEATAKTRVFRAREKMKAALADWKQP